MSLLLDELVDFYEIKYNRNLVQLRDFADDLGVLNWKIPVCTVTGTNGKGSTVTALSKIYALNGYQVGVFTSPHLLSVHERIRINETLITTDEMNRLTKQLTNYEYFHLFSWFEISLLIALVYFKQKNIDVLILEVGIGGEMDATNIIDADLVVITNVDYDHQSYLGNTLESIGHQKAGLFRQHRQAIFAAESCPLSVTQRAKNLNVDLKYFNQDFFYQAHPHHWQLSFDDQFYDFTGLPNIHLSAMSTAIYASHLLKNRLNIDEQLWHQANAEVFIPGRFQVIDGPNTVILDVGHNPHAANLLVERLTSLEVGGKIHLLISFLKDKDAHKVVNILQKMSFLCYPCLLDSKRACEMSDLEALFPGEKIYMSPEAALKAAQAQAKAGDMIVAFGSFYLISPLMQRFTEEGYDVFRNHRRN